MKNIILCDNYDNLEVDFQKIVILLKNDSRSNFRKSGIGKDCSEINLKGFKLQITSCN